MARPILQPHQMIVFEGDSQTRRAIGPNVDVWPLLRMNNWHRSYAELTQEWLFANLPHLRLKMQNCAIGGSCILDMQARYEEQVKPHRPDWVIFTLGTNDCHRNVPPDTFAAKLSAYIEQAQRDSGATFYYVGGFLPMPGLSEADTRTVERATAYAAIARRLVRQSGGLAPDVPGMLRQKAQELYEQSPEYHRLYSDGTHLNMLGHTCMSGLVLQGLGAYDLLPKLGERREAAPTPRPER